MYDVLTTMLAMYSDETLFQGGQIHPISIKDVFPGGYHAASASNEGQQPD